MHNSDAISIVNCALNSPSCFAWGSETNCFYEIANVENIGCEFKHACFSSCSFFALYPPQTMGKCLDISIARGKCLCVSEKYGFMVKKLLHYNLGPRVVFETWELYLLSVPSSTGRPWRPWETAGDHRGQFPHIDFVWLRKSSPLPKPPGPIKLRLFGEL